MDIEELRDIYREKKIKDFKDKKYDYASLWLADVEKFYKSKYKYNLGYKRKGDALPRKRRPAIVIEKVDCYYNVIFLTKKAGGYPKVDFAYCEKHYCKYDFQWADSVRVFSRRIKDGKRIRKIFKINEEDMEFFMEYCGKCDEAYIKRIKREIKEAREYYCFFLF